MNLAQYDTNNKGAITDIERLDAYWNLNDNFQVNTSIAARLLGKSASTLKAWRTRGVGPKYANVRPVTYSIGDLKAYLNDIQVKPC